MYERTEVIETWAIRDGVKCKVYIAVVIRWKV